MHPARLISLIVVCLLAFALQAEAGGRSRFRVYQGILLDDVSQLNREAPAFH